MIRALGAHGHIRPSLAATFSGGVTNTGTICPGGISVISGAFLSGGGILDSGVVSGGIKVDSNSRIVAGSTQTAIAVKNVSMFAGGITLPTAARSRLKSSALRSRMYRPLPAVLATTARSLLLERHCGRWDYFTRPSSFDL
jgi:hypothetical protein